MLYTTNCNANLAPKIKQLNFIKFLNSKLNILNYVV